MKHRCPPLRIEAGRTNRPPRAERQCQGGRSPLDSDHTPRTRRPGAWHEVLSGVRMQRLSARAPNRTTYIGASTATCMRTTPRDGVKGGRPNLADCASSARPHVSPLGDDGALAKHVAQRQWFFSRTVPALPSQHDDLTHRKVRPLGRPRLPAHDCFTWNSRALQSRIHACEGPDMTKGPAQQPAPSVIRRSGTQHVRPVGSPRADSARRPRSRSTARQRRRCRARPCARTGSSRRARRARRTRGRARSPRSATVTSSARRAAR